MDPSTLTDDELVARFEEIIHEWWDSSPWVINDYSEQLVVLRDEIKRRMKGE